MLRIQRLMVRGMRVSGPLQDDEVGRVGIEERSSKAFPTVGPLPSDDWNRVFDQHTMVWAAGHVPLSGRKELADLLLGYVATGDAKRSRPSDDFVLAPPPDQQHPSARTPVSGDTS